MNAYVKIRIPEIMSRYCKRRPTDFYITSANYEPCWRLAAGLQRDVNDATGVEARQGLQPAYGRSPACLCVACISAAKKSLSLSTPRSMAWPARSGVPRFLVIDRLPFSAEAGAGGVPGPDEFPALAADAARIAEATGAWRDRPATPCARPHVSLTGLSASRKVM